MRSPNLQRLRSRIRRADRPHPARASDRNPVEEVFSTEAEADERARRLNIELGEQGHTEDYYMAVERDGAWLVVRRESERRSLWQSILDAVTAGPWP